MISTKLILGCKHKTEDGKKSLQYYFQVSDEANPFSNALPGAGLQIFKVCKMTQPYFECCRQTKEK